MPRSALARLHPADLARIPISALLYWIGFNANSRALLGWVIFHLTGSLLWPVARALGAIDEQKHPSWSFVPTLMDSLAIGIALWATGANSFFIAAYVGQIAICSMNLRCRQGELAAGVALVSYVGINLAIYLGWIPYYDAFGGSREGISLSSMVTGASIVLVVAGGTYLAVHSLAAKNEQLRRVAEEQRNRATTLLFSILPETVALELQCHGHVKPQIYEKVAVLFVDFVGFTRITETHSPANLIEELDGYFSFFDSVVAGHGLERLKTIGDAYMAAAGVPTPAANPTASATAVALEIMSFMKQSNSRRAGDEQPWRVRIGIHSGPVIAGVIGQTKFAYDIWGDTVNTAARVQEASLPDRITLSEIAHGQVHDQFDCEHVGEVLLKGKGRMNLYTVIGRTGQATPSLPPA